MAMSHEPRKPEGSETPDTGHAYDGIREYDNPLPGWWVWIFWGTIIWSAFYLFFALLPPKMLSGQAMLAADQEEANLRLFGALPDDLKLDDATIVKYAQDEKWTRIGRSIFQSKCVSCHGMNAQGDAGPNLTDDYYIHVKTPADICDVIDKGRKNGAMPAWGAFLKKNEILVVASYVASLRGTNVPGKAHEGEVPVMPWGKVAK